MTLFGKNRKLRALSLLMAALVHFLALSAGVLAMRRRELLHDLERVHAVKELKLMGTLAREVLLKRDYATVVQFLQGAVAFLAFTLVMGTVLWVTLRRTAIVPMEEGP